MNDWVSVSISRGPIKGPYKNNIGLKINVKARPEIEDFMRKLADGRTVGIAAFGNEWIPSTSTELLSYVIDRDLSGKHYAFNNISGPLFVITGRATRRADGSIEPATERLNLSFLCLSGISQNEEGLTFGIDGIYSADFIAKVKAELPIALKHFLNDYIVPLSINLSIVSKNF